MRLYPRFIRRVSVVFISAAIAVLGACTDVEETTSTPTSEPTPDVRATVEAEIEARLPEALDRRQPSLEATIAARVAAGLPTPVPTPTAAPTPTPQPTATPPPTPSQTPTPRPTPTSTPTPTPSPSPTPEPGATATPTPTPTSTATPLPVVTESTVSQAIRPSLVRVETPLSASTGVIVEASSSAGTALVLTSAHATSGSALIDVRLSESRSYEGELLGEDTTRDLALVEICCASDFQAIGMGTSEGADRGKRVFLAAFPQEGSLSLEVTESVVLDREFDAGRDRFQAEVDVSLGDRMSGAAMISDDVRLVGIGSFSAAASEDGFGFVISQPTLETTMPGLRSGPFSVVPTPEPGQFEGGGPVYGPASDSLEHDSEGSQPVADSANLDIEDAVIHATFENPYSSDEGPWSYGIEFRVDGDARHTVFMRSDRRWRHRVNPVDGPVSFAAVGSADNIRTGESEQNQITVVAVDGRGWLFINNHMTAVLDLTRVSEPGDVRVVSGLEDQLPDATTRYNDFTVFEPGEESSFGSGSLVRQSSGFIPTRGAGVNFRDAIATATFDNPDIAAGRRWTYGLLIRRSEVNTFHAVYIDSTGSWHHHVRTGSASTDREIAHGSSSAIRTGSGSQNTLRVVATGSAGALLVNGQPVGDLDLSALQSPGDVHVFAGYFNSDQGVGVATDYEEHAVRPIR